MSKNVSVARGGSAFVAAALVVVRDESVDSMHCGQGDVSGFAVW